ncbi:MAG: acetyl-CoA carboxylase biotin carboxyl carrier protein [Cyanobacteria bacterium P01_A01_bin.105]
MDLNFNELRQLVAALDQTDVAELTLKSSDFELTLRKSTGVVASTVATIVDPLPAAPAPTPQLSAEPTVAPEPTPPKVDSNLQEITSPMVGTFYRSPAPEEPAFVSPGDRIQTGQTVCIIEAMKLMNELEAEISGEIVEVLVENAEPVEFGQPLMRVKPL